MGVPPFRRDMIILQQRIFVAKNLYFAGGPDMLANGNRHGRCLLNFNGHIIRFIAQSREASRADFAATRAGWKRAPHLSSAARAGHHQSSVSTSPVATGGTLHRCRRGAAQFKADQAFLPLRHGLGVSRRVRPLNHVVRQYQDRTCISCLLLNGACRLVIDHVRTRLTAHRLTRII